MPINRSEPVWFPQLILNLHYCPPAILFTLLAGVYRLFERNWWALQLERTLACVAVNVVDLGWCSLPDALHLQYVRF